MDRTTPDMTLSDKTTGQTDLVKKAVFTWTQRQFQEPLSSVLVSKDGLTVKDKHKMVM
jgi:hypothetical protein